ncbi:hypothetical protein ABKV49_13720 [Enterobacter ludwigii]|uniref:Uncharacterized protein n=1 Tax=Enterobacter ludwigii TaxID=299767 RepID=A0AAX3L681_9ENTR|nr:hypothetical protein [Enterobacter ludwigii]MBX8912950.1 hypothetical protein [Enterobacter ludwigii]WCE11514.1 hypothetical protein PHA72_15630 [Enterobacter ludwigii]
MKQKFIEWFTKNNNGCSPAMEDDRSFVYEMTRHMFEAYQAGVAEGEAKCAALASLESEPVAWLLSGGGAKNNVSFDSGNAYADPLREVTPLYTAPPAPVSVPDEVSWEDVPEEITEDDMALASAWAHGFNQCRAAMLQGAEPVTTAYKLPDDFDFGRFNDVVWLEAVASNPHMHSLTTSTIAMVALELNRKLADRNSTVIQDGWVACSERMPGEVLAALQNVARLRRNLNDFCGDKSLIAKCLSEAEGALLNAVNRHSTMLAEPLKEAKNV